MYLLRGLKDFPEYAGLEVPCNGCGNPIHIEHMILCRVIFPPDANNVTFYLVCYDCTLLRIEARGAC